MKVKTEILRDQYVDIEYRQFEKAPKLRLLMRVVGIVLLPFIYPFVLLAKLFPEAGFRTISQLISLIPFALGVIVRQEFYRRTLVEFGENVFIDFGTVLCFPEISIGSNVLIGMYNTIHHCDFGDNVMIAEGCRFLSGSKYHRYSRTDIPMTQQGGQLKRIHVGNDVWIGVNSVIMDDIGEGSVVAAGSVVNHKVKPYGIVAGVPAKLIGERK
jgi:virginiamycin A acetyltransferase